MASQITSITIVYSTVYSGTDQRKYQIPTSLAFVRGIHRWQVNSLHKWPVTRKMFHLMTSCTITNAVLVLCRHMAPSAASEQIFCLYIWRTADGRHRSNSNPKLYKRRWQVYRYQHNALQLSAWAVTHVPWCMLGSLTRGSLWSRWWVKRCRHFRRMHNPQFSVSDKRPMR